MLRLGPPLSPSFFFSCIKTPETADDKDTFPEKEEFVLIRRLFCALMCVLVLTGGARAEYSKELVRLHVVAADDSPAAQALKIQLRDTCLRCAQVCLSDAPDANTAYMRLEDHLADFETACTQRARELGYDGPVTAEAGVFSFPDRIYGRTLVPAGEYRALRITIGEGGGHNWWCILYPTLCMLNEQDAAGNTQPLDILSWLRARMGG